MAYSSKYDYIDTLISDAVGDNPDLDRALDFIFNKCNQKLSFNVDAVDYQGNKFSIDSGETIYSAFDNDVDLVFNWIRTFLNEPIKNETQATQAVINFCARMLLIVS